ncbi:hypothetical protein ABZ656_21960 [Streptomyces sp. NPDC007095]|uniref:hypothetical protein n=1 Tax=Streptomyces sp. NPDC007095 TaxID=3154482 RepID=UPI0033D065AC
MAFDITILLGSAHGPESGIAWRLGTKKPRDLKGPTGTSFPASISAQRPAVHCDADGVMP